MPNPGMEERGRALEKAFFPKQHREQLAQLRWKQEESKAREALADASGLHDSDLLARLAGLGIRAETLAALTLIPLVEVAWADGEIDPREREAILRGAESVQIAKSSPSYTLLEIWTLDRPAPDLMETWRHYLHALTSELTREQKQHLEEKIVGRARAVAEAAGGFLGLGSGTSVSPEEEAVLAKLARAFAAS